MRLRTTMTALVLLASAALGGALRADSVDDYVRAEMADRHIPGLSIAVVRDGKVVKEQGYGAASLELSVPAKPPTVYQIGSLTKQFTATAILRLAQDGKLSVDDKAAQYVEGLPEAWKGITVRQLLNQTSGLPNYRDGIDLPGGAYLKSYTGPDILRLASDRPLLFAPGTRYSYSNTNYHLLGMIVEKVGGKPYGDFLQEHFFGPLGMTATRLNEPTAILPNRAQGYLWDGAALRSSVFAFNPSVAFGDDGVVSTVEDLVKWSVALDGETVLNPASKALLWTPPTLPGGVPTEYAAGWFAARAGTHRLLWHNGATFAGFTGVLFRFPDDHLTLVVLSNSLDVPGLSSTYPLYDLTLGLACQYLRDLPKPPAVLPVKETDPQMAALVRLVSDQFAQDKLDKSLFAPAFRALLTPAATDPAHALLAPLGKMTSLTLLRRAPDGSALYRALYGQTAVDWLISVGPDHKITGLRPLPE